jgi:RNA recognition motif-containing protein
MISKLYVGNLPFSVTEDQLTSLFSQFGTVESVKIVKDTFDGRSKGFGFVEMSSNDEAELASKNLNGTEFEGRSIRVDLARPKENRPARDNNSRGPRTGGSDRRSSGGFRQSNSSSDRRSRGGW